MCLLLRLTLAVLLLASPGALAQRPPGSLVERLRSPDAQVADAALERALARQTDPAVCAALGALVRNPSVEEAAREEFVPRAIRGAQAPCLHAALRDTLASGTRFTGLALVRLSELTKDPSQRLQDLLRYIDSGKVLNHNLLPARHHPQLVSELSARVTRGSPRPVVLASAHLLSSLTWDERLLGRELLGLAAASPACEVRAALLHGPYATVGSREELVTLYEPLLSSEGRARALGTPKDCARAHSQAAYNLASRLRELYPADGPSDPVAWALLLSSLQGSEAEAARERVRAIFDTVSQCLKRPATAPPGAFEELLMVLGGRAC